MEPIDIAGDLEPLEAKLAAELAQKAKTRAFLTEIVHEAGQIAGAEAELLGAVAAGLTGNPLIGVGVTAIATAAGEATKGSGLSVPKSAIASLAEAGSEKAAAEVAALVGRPDLAPAIAAAAQKAAAAALANQ